MVKNGRDPMIRVAYFDENNYIRVAKFHDENCAKEFAHLVHGKTISHEEEKEDVWNKLFIPRKGGI